MTVVVTAVFHPVAGRTADLVAALRASIPAVHEEQGCQLYAIHDAEDGTITMIEKWDSAEDSRRARLRGGGRGRAGGGRGLLAQAPTVTSMTPLPAGTPEQGEL